MPTSVSTRFKNVQPTQLDPIELFLPVENTIDVRYWREEKALSSESHLTLDNFNSLGFGIELCLWANTVQEEFYWGHQPALWNAVSDLVAARPQSDALGILDTKYVFSDRLIVLRFLAKNKHLIPILFDAPSKVQSIFEVEVQLVLEVLRDPEERTEELFLLIKSNLNASESRAKLDQLVDVWFLDIMDSTEGKMNISEDAL